VILEDRHLKFARSTRYLSHYVRAGVHRTPAQVKQYAQRELKKLGYKLRKKRGPSSWKTKRMTTKGLRTVYLGVEWDEKTPEYQAATLLHELGHANQDRGIRGWLRRYIFHPRFRICVEFQMYRENVRAYRAMGATEAQLLAYARKLPSMLIKSYVILNRGLRASIRQHMVQIVMLP
jgi:hypothetical protein